jgi:divalent metal cation (Fe/Co/Zn/Cd) transporter
MTYGWRRVEILGAVMNATFLLALCFYIVLESIPRFISPPSVVQNGNASSAGDYENYSDVGTRECNISESVRGDWWYIGTAIGILCVNVFSAVIFAGMVHVISKK